LNISIDSLADAVARRIKPTIPLSVAQWDSKACAEYLGVSLRHFNTFIKTQPDFPKARSLPSSGKGDGHPRWKAQDVIEWFEGR
jgi:predicted DNA-binding transcriptional regulator AlpA